MVRRVDPESRSHVASLCGAEDVLQSALARLRLSPEVPLSTSLRAYVSASIEKIFRSKAESRTNYVALEFQRSVYRCVESGLDVVVCEREKESEAKVVLVFPHRGFFQARLHLKRKPLNFAQPEAEARVE